jgi:hypothetical protein
MATKSLTRPVLARDSCPGTWGMPSPDMTVAAEELPTLTAATSVLDRALANDRRRYSRS